VNSLKAENIDNDNELKSMEQSNDLKDILSLIVVTLILIVILLIAVLLLILKLSSSMNLFSKKNKL